MSQPSFFTRLEHAWIRQSSLLCVGLDPEPTLFPSTIKHNPAGVVAFCKEIAAAVSPFVCAFKPQFAHFAALGAEAELARLIDHLKTEYPHIPVILDAKRGDVGSTGVYYAREAFERYNADAVTVSPYLGLEGIEPFLNYPGRGVIVLCRTSNPDSAWLQMTPAADPLYLRVAGAVAQRNTEGNLALVTGATYPEQLAAVRSVVGDMPLLVPGIGAQGGDLNAVLAAGATPEGGLIISASRSVLYASAGGDFAEAAAAEAGRLRQAILGHWQPPGQAAAG